MSQKPGVEHHPAAVKWMPVLSHICVKSTTHSIQGAHTVTSTPRVLTHCHIHQRVLKTVCCIYSEKHSSNCAHLPQGVQALCPSTPGCSHCARPGMSPPAMSTLRSTAQAKQGSKATPIPILGKAESYRDKSVECRKGCLQMPTGGVFRVINKTVLCVS